MVTLNKIYTKTGDKGKTSLVSGKRVSKDNIRIRAYGTVDELNSNLGLGLAYMSDEGVTEFNELFEALQITLFDMGSRLACESENWEKFKLPNVSSEIIQKLENENFTMCFDCSCHQTIYNYKQNEM